MKERYFWNREIEVPENLEDFSSPRELLEALKSPEDRFSFVIPARNDKVARDYNQRTLSFGFWIRIFQLKQELKGE